MHSKRLYSIIACVVLVDLLSVPGAFCSATAPLPAGLNKYPEITATAVTPVTAATPVTGTTPALPVTGAFTDTLYDVWLRGHTAADIGNTVQHLNTLKLDNGYMNLYPYSLALLNQYKDGQGKQLLKYAELLSPSMADPYFELSHLRLTGREKNYALAGLELVRAGKAFFNDPYNILRFVSNRFINITATILIGFFIFAFLLLGRYSVQIFASIKDRLPETVPVYAIILFSVVIAVSPFLFGMGFLWLVILWLAVTLVYQKLPERIMSVGFMVFLTLFTYITLFVVATISKPTEEPFTGIMSIHYGNLSGKDIQGLYAYAENHQEDLYSNLYLGVYYKRMGDYDTASTYYRRLLAHGYGNLPLVMTDKANLDYAMGNIASAYNGYKSAIAAAPGLFVAHYNLGQLDLIHANIEGTNELDIARSINPGLFAYYASIYQKSNVNRIFGDALPEPTEIAYRMVMATLHNETAVGLAAVIISRLIVWPSAKYLPYLGLWLLLSFLMIIMLSRYVRTHLRCRSCGKVYTIFNRNDEYRDSVCIDCLRFYIKNDIKDSRKKLEITQRVHRWKKTLRVLTIGTVLLIPGSGSIICGRTMRGMVVLLIFLYLLVEYVSSFGLIAPVFPVSNPYTGLLKIVVLLLMVIIYAGNLFFTVKREVTWS